jgi:hypothetical protein
MDESCGKCIPCRAGTVVLHRLLQRISQGQGTRADLDQLEALCDMVKHTSLCGLGQSAPNPVLSTLRYFRHEYEALIRDGAAASRRDGSGAIGPTILGPAQSAAAPDQPPAQVGAYPSPQQGG